MGANSTLTLQENTANLNAGTDLQMATGAVLSIQDNSVLNLNVDFTNLSGRTLSLDTGGTLAGTGTLINQGQMVSNNGTLSLDGVVRNQIEGGIDVAGTSTLTGSGTIQNEGDFDFTLQDDTIDLTFIQDSTAAGVLRLGGSLSIGGTLVFETGSAVDLDTLVDGEVVTSGSGTIDNSTALDLNFDSFATANITNRSGGLIDLQGGTVSHIISTLFDNQAGATLVASTSQSEIDLTGSGVLQNAGQINVTGFGDSLTVINGELQNSGGIDIALGASVDISGGTLTMLSGGVLTGTGSVTLASEFNVGAGVDFTLTNGGPSLELTSGDIAGTGTMTNDGDITMTTGGAVNIADFTNTGDFKVTAGTGFTVSAGTNFTNAAGGTLTLEGSAAAPGALLQVSSDWTNSGVIDLTSDVNTAHGSLRFFGATLTNLGTLQTSGTSSASPNTFGDALVNSGTIDVNTANFQIGVTSVTNLSGGIVNVEDGNRLLFDQIPGSANVFENQSGGTITLNNTGQFFITNDNVVINDGNLEIGGGELSISGDGTFTQNSNIVLSTSGGKITVGDFGTAGTLNGTGTLTAQANTTLSLDDNGVLALDTDAFGVVSSNNNTFNVDSTLTLNAGSTFDLTGSNNLAGAGVFDNRQDITLDGETIGATFQQTAGTATLGDTVSVNGSFIVDTGAELITDQTDDTVAGTGSIIVRGNAGFDFINIDTSTLTVENGGIANFVGDIDITSTDINFLSGATTNFNGGDGGPIVNVGATGTFSNAGAIDLPGAGDITFVEGTYVNESGGLISIDDDSDLNVNQGRFSNFGSITMGAGGSFGAELSTNSSGIFRNEVGGTLSSVSGSNVNINIGTGDINSANLGVMQFNDAITFNFATGTIFRNDNLIDINNTPDGLTLSGAGTFNNNAAGTITLDGVGTITQIGGAVLNDTGTILFGNSPGTLTIGGDYLRGDTAYMEFELGGLAAGVHDGYDQLTVDGTVFASGTLDIVEYGGFDVGVGDSFTIVQADAIEDSFDAIDGLDVGGGVVLDAVQSASAITLTGKTVTHQGDGGDNTLTGSAGDDVMSAGGGDDFIVGGGGADLMHGGDGDDVFAVSDTGFGRLDGGGGTDLVSFDGAGQTFDLTQLRGDQLGGIERIDFGGFGDNILVIDDRIAFAATGGANSLTGAEHSLVIDGESGDSLNATGDWNNTGTVTIGGEGYTVY